MIAEAKQFVIEQKWEMLAWAVSYIISYTGKLKRPISPEKLLNKKKQQKKIEKEQKEKEWKELKRIFKVV